MSHVQTLKLESSVTEEAIKSQKMDEMRATKIRLRMLQLIEKGIT